MVTFIQSKATSNAGARASEPVACDPQWQPRLFDVAECPLQSSAEGQKKKRTNAKEKNAYNRK